MRKLPIFKRIVFTISISIMISLTIFANNPAKKRVKRPTTKKVSVKKQNPKGLQVEPVDFKTKIKKDTDPKGLQVEPVDF